MSETMPDAITRTLDIVNKRGLHARASARFVEMANGFNAWGGIFFLDGRWHAVGGAKGRAPRLLGSTWSSFSELAMRLAPEAPVIEMSGKDF